MMGTAAGMMIEENLAIASRRGQTPGLGWSCSSSQHEYFRELLKELDLGLENRMTAKVGLLSGGQRQALTLLMATLKKPKLLLLDEHTAALDPKTAEKVLNLTEKIVTRDNLTTLMITHNMRDALRFGNRLIMLHNGQIIIDVQGEEKSTCRSTTFWICSSRPAATKWPATACCWDKQQSLSLHSGGRLSDYLSRIAASSPASAANAEAPCFCRKSLLRNPQVMLMQGSPALRAVSMSTSESPI